jgi:hypothetical protein
MPKRGNKRPRPDEGNEFECFAYRNALPIPLFDRISQDAKHRVNKVTRFACLRAHLAQESVSFFLPVVDSSMRKLAKPRVAIEQAVQLLYRNLPQKLPPLAGNFAAMTLEYPQQH